MHHLFRLRWEQRRKFLLHLHQQSFQQAKSTLSQQRKVPMAMIVLNRIKKRVHSRLPWTWTKKKRKSLIKTWVNIWVRKGTKRAAVRLVKFVINGRHRGWVEGDVKIKKNKFFWEWENNANFIIQRIKKVIFLKVSFSCFHSPIKFNLEYTRKKMKKTICVENL